MEMVEDSAFWEVHHEVQGVLEELDHFQDGLPAAKDRFPEDHQRLSLNHCWQMEVS